MPAPQAVQAQIARAKELQDQLALGGIPPLDAAPEPGGGTPAGPVDLPGDLPQLTPTGGQPAGGGQTLEEQVAQLAEDNRRLAASLSVLQGKYDAEVRDGANRDAQNELRRLREENEQLKQAATSGQGNLDDAIEVLRGELGDASADAIQRFIQSKFGTVEKRVEAVSATAARSLEGRYYEALDTGVKGWREINKQPDFLVWLDTRAPFSAGRTYRDLMQEAHDSLDSASVIEIFSAYASTRQPVTPAGNGIDISPGRSAGPTSGSTPASSQRYWTREEVRRVYEAKRQGRLTPQQFEAYEAEFDAAIREGRMERAR